MPTVTIGGRSGATFSGMQDAALFASFPDTNLSTESGIDLPFLMRPDLTGITGPLTVTDAFWTFYITSGASGSSSFIVVPVIRSWVEAQATWNSWATSSAWNTAGAQGVGTDIVGTAIMTLDNPGGFYTGDIVSTSNANLIAALQDYFDGTTLDFSIRVDPNGFPGSLALPASATAAQRPLLTIVYTEGGGGVEEDLAGSAAEGSQGTTTPTIVVQL